MIFGRRYPLLLLAALISIAAATAPTAAHGVLDRSVPPANTSLDVPLREVVLWITEPVDPAFSSASVHDAQGKRVSQRVEVSADRRRLTVSLGELTGGIYTVRWRVLSAVDGHTTSGALVFAVGQPVPAGLGGPEPAPPRPITVVVRWAGFLAAILLAGSVFFKLTVLRPALAGINSQAAVSLRAAIGRPLRSLEVVAGLILLLGVAAEFGLTAAALVDVSLPQAATRGLLWPLLFSTKIGWSALVRTGLALLLLLPSSRWGRVLQSGGLILFIGLGGLAVLFRGPAALASPTHLGHLTLVLLVSSVYGLVNAVRRPPAVDWVPTLAAAGLLAGFTVTSHAFGRGMPAAIADWLHLLAAALWIGGLASLFLTMLAAGASTRRTGDAFDGQAAATTGRRQVSQDLVQRFSTLAAISLGVLILTGFYSAWLHVPTLHALTITAYGRALLLKLLLILPLVTLGVLNHFVLRPRLVAATERSHPTAQQRFLRVVTGEVGVGAVILLVVAALTITPPATVTVPAATQEAPRLAGLAGDLQVRLAITPAQPGWNRYEVVAAGPGGPVTRDARVILRLRKLDESLTPTTVSLVHQGQGRYTASGGELALPGWWEVDVVARRRGRRDVSTTFPLRLGQPPPRASDPAALALLEQARRAAAALRRWRETEQLTDGRGNVVVTHYDLIPPNRLRYRTSGGTEAVIIGATRYLRSDAGPWERDTLPQSLTVAGPLLYMRSAEAATLGRRDSCARESCQVVLWEAPGRNAAFAAWIGTSGRVYRLLMVAASHYMTSRSSDFNAPFQIAPP